MSGLQFLEFSKKFPLVHIVYRPIIPAGVALTEVGAAQKWRHIRGWKSEKKLENKKHQHCSKNIVASTHALSAATDGDKAVGMYVTPQTNAVTIIDLETSSHKMVKWEKKQQDWYS